MRVPSVGHPNEFGVVPGLFSRMSCGVVDLKMFMGSRPSCMTLSPISYFKNKSVLKRFFFVSFCSVIFELLHFAEVNKSQLCP